MRSHILSKHSDKRRWRQLRHATSLRRDLVDAESKRERAYRKRFLFSLRVFLYNHQQLSRMSRRRDDVRSSMILIIYKYSTKFFSKKILWCNVFSWFIFQKERNVCHSFREKFVVKKSLIQSKNSMFKYVVLIELKISNSKFNELEIFNSIKTTYLSFNWIAIFRSLNHFIFFDHDTRYNRLWSQWTDCDLNINDLWTISFIHFDSFDSLL